MADTAVKIPFQEAAAPSTPAATKVVIYAKSDGLMYSKDDAGTETLMSSGGSGSVATDAIWDAAGDLAVGTGANTAARLAIGATNGMALQRISGAVAWALPPGYEFDYVEKTSNTSITATTEGTANTVVTGNAVSYDGSTTVLIEFFAFSMNVPSGAGNNITAYLYDGSSSIGFLGRVRTPAAGTLQEVTVRMARRLTPSNASHTYSIRASVNTGTGSVDAGAGGSATVVPAFIRITKV